MREYDEKLVNVLQANTQLSEENGVRFLRKAVPDLKENNVMDPRVLETAIQKFKTINQSYDLEAFQLDGERNRPDKITYDLTVSHVSCRQILIPIDDRYINLYIFTPKRYNKKLPCIIYLHGGAFIAGDIKLYVNQCRLLAEKSESVVVFPEYRLAPENPFPAGIDDCYGTLQWVNKNDKFLNIDPGKIVMAGDSAGAGLVSSCVLKDKEHKIKLAVEIYPVSDSDIISNGIYSWDYSMYNVAEEQKKYVYGRIDRIKSICDIVKDLYIHGRTTGKDPLVSINYLEDLSVFPKTLVIEAEYDFLRISNDIFIKRCKDAGVDIKAIRYMGCDHGFFDRLGLLPQAEDCILEIAKSVKEIDG